MRRYWKPWYVHNPRMLIQRWRYRSTGHHKGYVPWPTAWGADLRVDTTGVIGRDIAMTGVYDLALTECLTRLMTPGDTMLDVGGNVGYTTVLAAIATGAQGKVITFEPLPALADVLESNVKANGLEGRVELRRYALGDTPGKAPLHMPSGFEENDGIASLASRAPSGEVIDVDVWRLDDVFTGTAAVMKVDVEGFETQVFRGASRLLAAHQIKHVLFEEYDVVHSEAPRILADAGYTLFSIHRGMMGLRYRRLEQGPFDTGDEPPNFIATVAPSEVVRALAPRGYRSLRKLRPLTAKSAARSA